MDFHFSFSWWTPEIYLRAGPIHLYTSVWKTLMLIAVIMLIVRYLKGASEQARLGVALLVLTVAYLMSAFWPVGLEALALPWSNPPAHLSVNGRDYGTGQGTPDPRVDTYGCNSEESIRDGSFAADPLEVLSFEQVGHIGGVFGGPALYQLRTEGGGWLVVRPTADCWIPYPPWI